jgi:hypothetical protein
MKVNKDNVNLLKKSSLFDAEWYLEQYPDVAMCNMEPTQHYLQFGSILL